MLRRALNETWFSDTLAWLLDPKGSHGLGVKFLQAFLVTIAKKREEGLPNGTEYARRATHLKYGKSNNKGQATSKLTLANAAVLREFYLSGGIGRNAESGKYCDVVVTDLDSGDGLFLVVENKLFTTNHPRQLAGYLQTTETRYSRVPIREYVYLTLDGSEPVLGDEQDRAIHTRWVRMSWLGDVYEALLSTAKVSTPEPRVTEMISLLGWIRELVSWEGARGRGVSQEAVAQFAPTVLLAAAQCLHEELERLNGGIGSWGLAPKQLPTTNRRIQIGYSKTHAHRLHIELLPSYSVAVQSRHKGGEATFEKMLVPFGAHPDQVFNLLDITARDIYHAKFAKPDEALSDNRRLTKTVSLMKQKHRELFRFLYTRRFELKVLFGVYSLLSPALGEEE